MWAEGRLGFSIYSGLGFMLVRVIMVWEVLGLGFLRAWGFSGVRGWELGFRCSFSDVIRVSVCFYCFLLFRV